MKIFKLFIASLPIAIEILIGVALFFLPISKSAAEACFITALAFWILQKITSRDTLLPRSGIAILYALFLGITLASITQIPHPFLSTGLRGILKWLKYLSVFFMCWDTYNTPQKRSRLFWAFLASMFVVSLDGFWQLHTGKDIFFGYPLDPGRIVRIKGSLGAPNDLAAFLIFAVPLSVLNCYRNHSWRLRIVSGALCLLFLAAFFLTYSRGAFYAMVLSLVLNLLFIKKTRIAFATMACLALLVFTIPSFRYNFVKTIERNDITIVERGEYWKIASDMIKSHPLLGVGVNTYLVQLPNYVKNPETRQTYPHNCYLQMASEIGIPGTGIFLLALFCTLWRSVKQPGTRLHPVAIALRIALTSFLIQAFFDTNFYAFQTAYVFWIFWGMFSAITFTSTQLSARTTED